MSETDFLKLKKHDNVETNTEKFDIENYLNGNWDKINENAKKVNTDISNIKKEQETQNTNIEENNSKIVELQTEKAKLETELKEMQEDFYQNSIRGQASGEYIHVEDSSNCRSIIGIGGNHEQETREGYNLLNFKKWKDNNVSWNLGKNIVYGDNYVSGTSEGTDCYSNTVNEQYRFNCEPNTTYTLFYINDNSIMCRPIAFVYDSESKNIQTLELGLSADNIIIRRFTTSSEAKKMTIRLGTNVDGVNFKFSNIMILKGIYDKSTIPNYEQYGAMPSPDYQSEIKTVGDNVNLFDVAQMKQTIPVGTSDFIYLTKKPNTKYTLSTSLPLADNNTADIFLISGHTTVGTTTDNGVWKGNSRTITSDRNGYLTIAYRKQNVSSWTNLTSYKYKLAEGTETGEYSKYGQGCVKVTKCNKNLAKIDETNWTLTDNIIKNNGRNASFVLTRFKVRKGQKVNLRLKLFSQPAVDTSLMFYIDNAEDLNLSFMGIQKLKLNTTYTKTYIATKDCEISSKMWGNANADIFEFQFWAEIDKTTDYEQHEEQSYIMPVQKEILEDDYFDWDNEEEVHTWNKLVLNGTEKFNSWTGNAPSGYKVFYLKSLTNDINPQGDLKCNTFKYMENPWESGKNAIGLQRVFKEVYISIESKYASTLEEFKAYLKSQYDAGTPVVVYYKLATPNRLKFIDEQKAVAKELNNARTYKNVTNITTDSKAILSLDYAKDLETLLTSKESEV